MPPFIYSMMLNCGTMTPGPPTWEHFVLLIATRFRPRVTLGGGSSVGDIQGGNALFMDDDSGHDQPRVGPQDLDNSEIDNRGRNVPTQEDGHSSDGSVVLDTCGDVVLMTDDNDGVLTGICIDANRHGTQGGILAHGHGDGPSGSEKIVLFAN
jgi:hypothetical protein